MSDEPLPQSEFILYQTEDGRTRVQCRFGNETHWMLLLPPLVTAVLVIWAGVFADSPFSPLAWVKPNAEREYGP